MGNQHLKPRLNSTKKAKATNVTSIATADSSEFIFLLSEEVKVLYTSFHTIKPNEVLVYSPDMDYQYKFYPNVESKLVGIATHQNLVILTESNGAVTTYTETGERISRLELKSMFPASDFKELHLVSSVADSDGMFFGAKNPNCILAVNEYQRFTVLLAGKCIDVCTHGDFMLVLMLELQSHSVLICNKTGEFVGKISLGFLSQKLKFAISEVGNFYFNTGAALMSWNGTGLSTLKRKSKMSRNNIALHTHGKLLVSAFNKKLNVYSI